MSRTAKVACVTGAGTAPELMAEAMLALDAVARLHGLAIEETHVTFGGVAVARAGQSVPALDTGRDPRGRRGARGRCRGAGARRDHERARPARAGHARALRAATTTSHSSRRFAPGSEAVDDRSRVPDRRVAHDAHRRGRRRTLERSRRRGRGAPRARPRRAPRAEARHSAGRVQREPLRRRPRRPRRGRSRWSRSPQRRRPRASRRTGCWRSTGRASSCRRPTAASRSPAAASSTRAACCSPRR